jgi:hypothetical protein
MVKSGNDSVYDLLDGVSVEVFGDILAALGDQQQVFGG